LASDLFQAPVVNEAAAGDGSTSYIRSIDAAMKTLLLICAFGTPQADRSITTA
jgi:hypothetical protein